MVAVTSISPVHVNKDIQAQAVQSWIDCGMKVYSINNKDECKKLAPIYPNVTFVETQRTMEETFGKPYVSLSAIFDWCKTQKDNVFCLINSDIELKTDKETIERIEKKAIDNNLILANRVNYVSDYKGSRYLAGIDVFFMNKQIIHSFPQNLFCLGQCHFDYYIPYHASQKGYNLIFLRQDIAFHKEHGAQYKQDDWVRTGQHFIWLSELYQFTNQVGRMSTHIYNYIYSAAKRLEI